MLNEEEKEKIRSPKILIVLPAYNEGKIIVATLTTLNNYLNQILGLTNYLIVVVDNSSNDKTGEIVKKFSQQNDKIAYLFLAQNGKGLAIRTAWKKYLNDFDIFAFMDADLATGLEAFGPLISAISQGYDLALGCRYHADSKVQTPFLRKIFSFGYRLFLRLFLGTKIKDLPCGFKAVSKKVVQEIVPHIVNNTWFFDSELVYLAEKNNFKITEIPVTWQEPRQKDDKSRVSIFKVTLLYLKEVIKLKFR